MTDSPLAQLFANTDTAVSGAGTGDTLPVIDTSKVKVPKAKPEVDVASASEAVAAAEVVHEQSSGRTPTSPGTAATGTSIGPIAADASTYLAVIRVVGVGGAGLNALERMMDADVRGVEFVAVNTDLQQLETSNAPVRLHIGNELTGGLGSGADPEIGKAAAESSYDHLRHVLKGSDMVFVTCGEGGGTGTGAAPVVCRAARELGALTVAIVTTPFMFEGTHRSRSASQGLEALRREADTVIVIPNNRLLEVLHRDVSMIEAFRVADDVLRQGVQGICDLITMPGLINVDFADVRTVMGDSGSALMGIGFGTGENRAVDAAMSAINSPLIEQSPSGAKGILLNISGGDDLTLFEVTEAAKVIQQSASPDAEIIFGSTIDSRLTGQVWVTVVATGFGVEQHRAAASSRATILGSRAGRHPAHQAPVVDTSDDMELPGFLRR
jgi:cell division protein FtsZ